MPEFFGGTPHSGDRGREDRLRRSLSEDPDDPTGHALLGLYLTIRGLHREAIEEARLALRLDPDTALAHYVLSLSVSARLDWRRKIGEAIDQAEEAIRLDPRSPSFYAQLAHLRLLQHSSSLRARDASSALRAAEAGRTVDPLDVPCTVLSGLAFGKLGRHEEAEAAFSTALALDPESAYAHASYGRYLFRRGEFERAVASLQEASRREPCSTLHRRMLGLVRGVKWAVDGIMGAASCLRFIRLGPGEARPWSGGRMGGVNWTAGLLLWLFVMSGTSLLLMNAGDLSIMALFLPLGLLSMIGAASLARFGGLKRLAVGIGSGVSGLLWLEVTALMIIWPDRISSAPRAAWPDLGLGPSFHLVRAVGLLSIGGMMLFLIVVYLRGFFAGGTYGSGSGQNTRVMDG